MGTNHLGHFLLTMLLLPALRRGTAHLQTIGGKPAHVGLTKARVVHVASLMHKVGYVVKEDMHSAQQGRFASGLAYGSSKLA